MKNHIQLMPQANHYLQLFHQAWHNLELLKKEEDIEAKRFRKLRPASRTDFRRRPS